MSLLFKFRPLVVNPELAARIGLNEAIVLQQLNYWLVETESGVEHDGRRWIYNTLEQWQKQFPFWSVDTVKRALASLQKQKILLVEKLAKAKRDQTNFYSIDYEASALMEECKMPSSERCKMPSSGRADCPDVLTETTTETTAESNRQLALAQVDDDLDTSIEKATRGKPKKPAPDRIDISLPDWVPQAAWEDFVDMRKKIRAPLTERAKLLAVQKLDGLRQEGHLPLAVLEQSTLNGWKGLFPVKGGSGPRGYSKQAAIEERNRQAAEEFVNGGNWQ